MAKITYWKETKYLTKWSLWKDESDNIQSFSQTWQWNGLQAVKMYLKKTNGLSLWICNLKVIEGQVSLSTLFCILRVCINSSFFEYFVGLERSTSYELWENSHHRFFSFCQNQIFIYVWVYQIVAWLKISLILLRGTNLVRPLSFKDVRCHKMQKSYQLWPKQNI